MTLEEGYDQILTPRQLRRMESRDAAELTLLRMRYESHGMVDCGTKGQDGRPLQAEGTHDDSDLWGALSIGRRAEAHKEAHDYEHTGLDDVAVCPHASERVPEDEGRGNRPAQMPGAQSRVSLCTGSSRRW